MYLESYRSPLEFMLIGASLLHLCASNTRLNQVSLFQGKDMLNKMLVLAVMSASPSPCGLSLATSCRRLIGVDVGLNGCCRV